MTEHQDFRVVEYLFTSHCEGFKLITKIEFFFFTWERGDCARGEWVRGEKAGNMPIACQVKI